MAYQNRLFASLFPALAPKPALGPSDQYGLTNEQSNRTNPESPFYASGQEDVEMGDDDTTIAQRQLIDPTVAPQPSQPDQPTFPSTVQAPQAMDANGKPVVFDASSFQLPFADPQSNYESAYNALALGRNNYEHPVNKDRGVKGALKDIFTNLQRAGQFIRPGMGLGESLAVLGAGAAGGLIDRTQNERRDAGIALPGLEKDVQMAGQADMRQSQIDTIKRDDERQDRSARELSDWHNSETARKIDDRTSRERTSRMKTVAGMLKDLGEFIPGDPKFKAIEEALGDAKLPITQRDAKKKVDLKQDQRTGAWTVILTDPVSMKQEVRDVIKDGKPFTSTPTVVMQGELGLLKQNDAQEHDTEERTKDRALQIQKIEQAERQFNEKMTLERDALNQRIKSGDLAAQDRLDALKANVASRAAWIDANITDPNKRAELKAALPKFE